MRADASRHVTLLPAESGDSHVERVRLFCFPHAGAGVAAYRAWRPHLPAHVELALVHLPGREARTREPPLARMEDALAHIEEALQPFLDAPFAFFGHSFGAMLAFELTHHFAARGGPHPTRLVVSGCPAPHLPDPLDALRALPDDALATRLADLGGTPPELLQHKELMALVLPVLRADLNVLATRAKREPAPLPCPVTALAGDADPIAPPRAVDAWRAHATDYRLHVVPGGHFFLQSAQEDVLATLGAALARRREDS